ncbi:hypothetical protein HBI83_060990 [Parastagonospora nodorum]|nr:hypothetical protein HBI83_060990 [Parastagonospora nodorum]
MSNNPSSAYWIDTEDWHTAGEPFHIVEHLPADHLPSGVTVAERRAAVVGTPSHPLNVLRQTLCHEPRGHGDMYGGFITPPDDADAQFGVLFWHKDGFSTACGHGTIALGYWAVSKGIVEMPRGKGEVDVIIDVPSGRVKASVVVEDGKPVHADFVNVQSHVLTGKIPLAIPFYEDGLFVQFSYAGACYGFVDAKELGLSVTPNNVKEFVRLGRDIKALVRSGATGLITPYELYGIVFFENQDEVPIGTEDLTIRERNTTVFADGQVDRSPCGSGTSARLAIHYTDEKISVQHGKLLNSSIIGTQFEGDIVSGEQSSVGGYPTCIPRVRGKANLVGRMSFYIDPADPVYPGFLL